MNWRKLAPPLLILMLIGINFAIFAPWMLHSPNSHFLKSSGDGFKNYFTPWYHITYDEGYTWFEGMNYPWGEHIVFTDAQPAIVNTLKFVFLRLN